MFFYDVYLVYIEKQNLSTINQFIILQIITMSHTPHWWGESCPRKLEALFMPDEEGQHVINRKLSKIYEFF